MLLFSCASESLFVINNVITEHSSAHVYVKCFFSRLRSRMYDGHINIVNVHFVERLLELEIGIVSFTPGSKVFII